MRQTIYLLAYLPIVLSYVIKGRKDLLVSQDIEQGRLNSAYYVTNNKFTSFLNFIVHYPEWRQVYFYRLGGVWKQLFRFLYPNKINFYLQLGGVKGGFYPQNAWSTIVLAKSVGRNF